MEIPQADERVLSTLNKDGSRRWLRPRVSPGRLLTARRVAAWVLILLFTALPYVRIGGKPAILLDLANREFTFFGKTLLATDTLLLALALLSIFIGIFLLTALLGRVWCGWACPQTVYMEFLYRPIERLFEGRHYTTGGRAELHPARKILKYVAFLFCSMFLAHTFLAYFVGVETLLHWVRQSPFEHPAAFLVMAAVTTLMMLDFAFMREQVCILMCPYGRLQSVLLDRRSLIVSYDPRRGEPRGKRKSKREVQDEELGDCIDCYRCVTTCPTGIDIRDGLQMECVNCAQCIDACDEVMDKVGKPRGLIRYSSQEAIETGASRILRPRVIVYPLILATTLTLFGITLGRKSTFDVTFLRNRNATYTQVEDRVRNVVQVKIQNRAEEARTYDVALGTPGATLESPDLPLTLGAGERRSIVLHVEIPSDRFERGRAALPLTVRDDAGAERSFEVNVLGPLYPGSRVPPAPGSQPEAQP